MGLGVCLECSSFPKTRASCLPLLSSLGSPAGTGSGFSSLEMLGQVQAKEDLLSRLPRVLSWPLFYFS